ncbi:unnamed protein product [Didymodactylos carnosus]|uniref:MATH domain-containing protein n=1 Tax=Didymodactylos carnosus TaxID=1234261 RepID=A0A814U3L4_9BILA|nr:unnamed protein product [Didymodactylos carnosus]CAF1269316.1 unnamed protein product [Didymodactylos carnosus]CAF3930307.1 unnamed protein product [Didymodactylos carnosus]CAF4075102.1 unnamed protein product [Didymodactylos carnosus]
MLEGTRIQSSVPSAMRKYPISELGTHLVQESHQTSILRFLKHIAYEIGPIVNEQRTTISTSHSPLETTNSARSGNTLKQENNVDHHAMDYESTVSEQMATKTSSLFAEVNKCHDTITVLSQGIQSLSNDTTRLGAESFRHQNSIQSAFSDVNQLKLSIKETDNYLAAIAPNQEMMQEQLSSIKQKVEETELSFYDGTLTWKVADISNKMADAQSERQTSIYSPPFYSSPAGYKMRARLYLHGDGQARRTHMSLFFVLMKGEYDPVLKWPFNHKVTFCLFDQSGQNRHVIDSFRPDTKSNSFQRPRSEMNIASGIPKFFPLPMIQQEHNNYVREDTMFIKVIVDFADLPKMILPYMLGLNPGLPSLVQEYMIRQENHKRQQAPTMATVVPPPVTTNSCG